MCVAMRAGGRSIGAAYVDSKPAAAAFTTDELALLAAFAGHAAAAIDAARLREAVQAANEAKSEFISLMTHELRIPLTSIRGYTDLLLKEMAGPLNDSQRQFLSTVRRNLDRMSVLIRDLSDMNRIESGRMHFECVPFALHGLLRTAAGDMQEAFTQRAQTISFSFPDQQTMVRADRSRVAHIVANLLSNAHNYTPEGGQIELRVHSAGGMAQVTVADKGIGIPEADLQQLFTPFFRGEAAAVREQSGWGLGLALARLLVEAQGGEIRCTSRAGEGSTFTFSLPLARPEEDSH